MRKAFGILMPIMLAGCAGTYDQEAIPSANAQYSLGLDQCEQRDRNDEFKSYGEGFECIISAGKAYAQAIKLKNKDLFEAYAARVRILASEADSEKLKQADISARYTSIYSSYMQSIKSAAEADELKRQQNAAALQNLGAALQGASQQIEPPAPVAAPTFPVNCRTVFVGNIARTQCY